MKEQELHSTSRAPRTVVPRRAAFTLLELLVVIALIGLLAGLLFPVVGAARRSAQVARTRVLFAQWATAIEAFRSEYGHYPAFDPSGLVNGGAVSSPAGEHLFHDILAGRRRDGSPLAASTGNVLSAASQNRRQLRFHAFAAAEMSGPAEAEPHLIRDGSGGTSIAVLVDRDLDGFIRIGPDGDYPAAPAVGGTVPSSDEWPKEGLRAGVAFYAPAPGTSTNEQRLVCSWR